MNQEIFKEACLIQLSTPCWQGSRMLDSSIMELIGKSEWLKGRKYLVDPETLSPIRAVIARARKDLEKTALPFPINGLTLVPKECLATIEERLLTHQEDFWKAVDEFVINYEDARQAAKDNLGELFSDQDYPLKIRQKFGFEWRYFSLTTPGKYQILTPEIYKREKEKFQSMMEETRELAMMALRKEFADHVDHIVERLTNDGDGKLKVFRNNMVVKMTEYLDSFDARNLFNDESLEEMVKSAREIIAGVKPGWLRENLQLQKHIRQQMSAVKTEIDKAIEDMPRRKIRIAA